MLDIAIICSTFPARSQLLQRSLLTWEKSIDDSGLNAKIFLYANDSSFENEADFELQQWKVVKERSGSHITGYNYWLERVEAKVYLFTHPDLLFPRDTVKVAYEEAQDNIFAAFKVFWLPKQMTEELNNYDWREPETLEKEIALFPKFNDGHGDFYWNGDVRDKTEWHSTTTWAMNHQTLQKLLPFPDFHEQGPDDPYFYGARMRLMIEDKCIMNPILFHQYHEQSWNQNMDQAVSLASKELKKRFK